MRNFGGRSAAYWKRMLTYPRASVRKLARRALSRPLPSPASGHITELLRQLLQCPASQVPARARALAQHGREVLPECLEAGRPCGPQTRRRLCQVFWHLGPQARGAEPLLARWLPDPEAEAALLAMEHLGSPLMLDAMVRSVQFYPIWLDQQAVDRLCDLALGSPVETLAVRALGGFGPARGRAVPFLKYLAEKGCLTSLESLLATGLPEAIDALLELNAFQAKLAPDPRFHLWPRHEDHLVQALFRLENWQEQRPRLQHLSQHRSEAVRLAALRLLLRHADPSWAPPLMRHPRPGVRLHAVNGLERPDLEAALNDPHPRVAERAATRLAYL